MKLKTTLLYGAGTLFVALGTVAAVERFYGKDGHELNMMPAFVASEVVRQVHDGVADDLLTAGLGASGLKSADAPAVADPTAPTAAELRRLAIYNNYRALVPVADGGGYGVLFGPNVAADGTPTDNEGLIAGEEWLAYLQAPSGSRAVAMVQVPKGFDPANACMVAAPSSGSRGIYGAIGTAGEWGLKRNCAVVYTDKGTGTGAHNLITDTVQLIDGRPADADEAGAQAHFRARLPEGQLKRFNDEHPHRFALKHAHSESNPEQDWGQHVLQSIEFGFYVLNEIHGGSGEADQRLRTITPENTLVIASSISNGGGASLRAAEQDAHGLIDAVAVSEPNVNPAHGSDFTIQQGDSAPIRNHSRSLLDYSSALAIYQGCANRAPSIRDQAPLNEALNNVQANENICASLAARGVVAGATTEQQAEDALRILNEDYGIQPEQNLLAPANFGIKVPQAIAVTYANAYGRFSVLDNVCGFSFSATGPDGTPTPQAPASEALLFATSNGAPPTGGINLIYNDSVGGAVEITKAASIDSGLEDYALDGLLCLRALASGVNPVSGEPLTGRMNERSIAIRRGIDAIRATADLGGRPALIVTGRADQILPINHTSRPYFGLNRSVEGNDSNLRYYEVLHGQHLDILNNFPGFDAAYIPMHYYFFQALDLVYDHLRNDAALPPSQVVRPTPRGAGAPPLSRGHLPDISRTPDAADRIVFLDSRVMVPD